MSKATLILAVTAALGLAACANEADQANQAAANANLVPLLDNTGRVALFAPASEVRNAPVGTAVVINNRDGLMEIFTVGARQDGVSTGTTPIVGSSDGAPQVVRVGGAGGLPAPGAAVVTGSPDGRRAATQADTATLPTSRRERARVAAGTSRPAPVPAN